MNYSGNNPLKLVILMAGGFAKDGAVQDQIDASTNDAIKHARAQLSHGQTLQRQPTEIILLPHKRCRLEYKPAPTVNMP